MQFRLIVAALLTGGAFTMAVPQIQTERYCLSKQLRCCEKLDAVSGLSQGIGTLLSDIGLPLNGFTDLLVGSGCEDIPKPGTLGNLKCSKTPACCKISDASVGYSIECEVVPDYPFIDKDRSKDQGKDKDEGLEKGQDQGQDEDLHLDQGPPKGGNKAGEI